MEQSRIAKIAGRPAFWVVIIIAMFTWPIVRSIRAAGDLPAELPVLAPAPQFELTDQLDNTFKNEQLLGRAWVASFAYSNCPDHCDAIMKPMFELQHRSRGLGDSFMLVTFTVDERDTPEQLLELLNHHRASKRRWTVLSGAKDALERVRNGMNIAALGPDSQKVPTTRVALIDPDMNIRAYYDLADDEQVDRLLYETGLLLNRGKWGIRK